MGFFLDFTDGTDGKNVSAINFSVCYDDYYFVIRSKTSWTHRT